MNRLIPILFVLLLGGCNATMHPDYQKVYFKQEVSSQQIEEILRRFSSQGLSNAKVSIDALGKIKLLGSYENEREVELAFTIARGVVGENAVSNVRPETIKQKDWEISAGKGFANFIEELGKKFNMSVHVEQSDESNLIGVSDTGLDGITQFDTNSSEPTPNAAQFYQQMAAEIASSHSEKDGNKRILIVGHTDDIGESHYNVLLSERRAHTIGKIFESAGISSDRIYYQGAGESLPVADNRTYEGRAKNRRVEIADLSKEEVFRQYLQSRRPNTAFYRPVDIAGSTKKPVNTVKVDDVPITTKPAFGKKGETQNIAKAPQTVQMENKSKPVLIQPSLQQDFIDFRGFPATPANTSVDFGSGVKIEQGFLNLINEAQASDMESIRYCYMDQPRNVGAVKSLKDGKVYESKDYLPGLYGRIWRNTVGGNLIVLNNVAVLRDGAAPANAPNLQVFANFNPKSNHKPKPDVMMTPEVNAYQVSNGLLYRIFTQNKHGMRCMDVLFSKDGSPTAKEGKVIYYGSTGNEFVADFKPIMMP
jgi:outer membrane protein OmpA-like peptidoglycan-associated protein